jgi:hypothetical protein
VRLRSLLFFVLYNLFGILHSIPSLLASPFQSFEQRYRFVNLWSRVTMWMLRHLNGVHIEVEGREHIPADRAVVVIANHQSQWETFYLQLVVSPQATILKRELRGHRAARRRHQRRDLPGGHAAGAGHARHVQRRRCHARLPGRCRRAPRGPQQRRLLAGTVHAAPAGDHPAAHR